MLMSCIAAILILNIKHNKSKIFHVACGIMISVIIYYINYFFNVIETSKCTLFDFYIGTFFILAMIASTYLLNINEK